jgi:hypothetical protein
MPQTFTPRTELFVKLVVLASFAAIGVALLVARGFLDADLQVGQPIAQPIPFSHKHHVGDVGLDCRMCHVTVERAALPGMPSAQICLTCHSQLFADQAVFEPLRRSAASGLPIAWRRVTRLADYVYFDHAVHVAKGVACIECHGRIDQMALTALAQPFEMKWCVACHDDPLSRLHPADAVFAMPPPPLAPAAARRLMQAAQLEPRARLTDCSTCHR